MIKQEQKELSEYVKQVHLSLRRESRKIGAEKAWEEHLKNEETLRKYSICMRKLAEDFWPVNNQTHDVSLCRIEWIVNHIVEYYQRGGLQQELIKERKKMESFYKKGLITSEELNLCVNEYRINPPYKTLDVGSCYNPLKNYDFLEVFPIDLYPASSDVKKCNFIKTKVQTILPDDWFCDEVTLIPSNFFDVVVFCLFLEYLPSPKQRYVSCVNAYNSLKTNGILLIITPDSKHATANAPLMKKWKIALAHLGFVRISLQKLKYLHCMVYRKSNSKKYPLLLNNLYNISSNDRCHPEEMIMIPQDTVEYDLEEKTNKKTNLNEEELREMFEELPFLSRD